MDEITLVRGDTLKLTLKNIKLSDGTEYVLNDTDIVYLDVKRYQNDKTAVIQKSGTKADYIDGGLPFVFLPADTVDLPIAEYWFNVRLFVDDDNIYTIIPMSKFRIVQNVTDIPVNGGWRLMAYREISLSGNISAVKMSGSLNTDTGMSGDLKMAERVYENDYEKLKNRPSINGVELVQDKSFEELGDHVLTNFEILELMKNAGF